MKTVDLIRKYKHIFGTIWYEDANCQGAWLMDTDVGGGALPDSSGEGNTAQVKGDGEPDYATATPPAVYTPGYYDFDGVNDYAIVTNSASIDLVGGVNYSFVVWAYPETDVGGGKGIMGKADDTVNNWWVIQREEKAFRWQSDDAVNKKDFSSSNYDKNSWYHLGGSKETGVGYKLYVDGIEDGTAVDNGSCANDHDFYLGFYKSDAVPFKGWEAEAAVFNRTIDSTEINDIMDNGLAGAGEEEESETWYVGAGNCYITYDKYQAGGGSGSVQYKTGTSREDCDADSWNSYTGPFNSEGWAKVKVLGA